MSSAVSKLRSVKLHILSKYDFVHNPPWCNDDQIVHFLRETCSECWLILNSGKPQRKNQWTRGLQEHGPFHEEKVPTALNVANSSSTGTDLWHSRKKTSGAKMHWITWFMNNSFHQIKGPDNPTCQFFSITKVWKWDGTGGKHNRRLWKTDCAKEFCVKVLCVCDSVVCERVVCERLYVKELCVKDLPETVVCARVVCDSLRVKEVRVCDPSEGM